MPRKFSPVSGVFLAVIVIVLVLGGSHLAQWLHPGQTITPRTVGNLEEVPILIRHDAGIWSIAFNPQPNADLSFVSSSGDGLIKLWHLDKDAGTNQVAVTEQSAMQAGPRIALSPDGKQLASIDFGDNTKVWDLTQIANMFSSIKDDQQAYPVSFSPDGRILASGHADGTIKLWDWQHSKILHRLKAYEGRVRAIAFSPDGQTLASSSEDSADPIKLWNWKTGEILRTLAGNKEEVYSPLAFSPNGQTLAIGSCDDSYSNCPIKLWDWRNGTEVRFFQREQSYTETADFIFSPDGQTLAISSENGITLWNPNDGTKALTIQEGSYPLGFSPDGQTLASISDNGTIKLWNRSDGRLIRDIQGREKNGSFFLTFSSDSRTLISASYDGAITLWNQRDGTEIFSFPIKGLTSVALSPDGQTLAIGSQDQGIQLLSLNYPAKLAQPLNVKLNSGRFVAFSPDQQHLILASLKEIKRLRLKDHQEVGNIQAELDEYLVASALSSDGEILARSEFDGPIKLWNLRNGKIMRTLQTGVDDTASSLAFSPDGQLLASAFPIRNTMQMWNLRNGKLMHQWDANRAFRVIFSPDGQLLASVNNYGEVQLWNPQTGKKLRTLKGHADGIGTLAFSPDGQTLATGSSDQTIKLWRVKQQQ